LPLAADTDAAAELASTPPSAIDPAAHPAAHPAAQLSGRPLRSLRLSLDSQLGHETDEAGRGAATSDAGGSVHLPPRVTLLDIESVTRSHEADREDSWAERAVGLLDAALASLPATARLTGRPLRGSLLSSLFDGEPGSAPQSARPPEPGRAPQLVKARLAPPIPPEPATVIVSVAREEDGDEDSEDTVESDTSDDDEDEDDDEGMLHRARLNSLRRTIDE
jgi:hypothetical protein